MKAKQDFVWGAATASFQIEGAAYEDGKSPSIWDVFCEVPGNVFEGHNGLVACDHYHRVDEDVKLMAQIGIKAYRFSVSWPRIMPSGSGEVNPKGIEFYNHLIDKLKEYNIEPYLTLYHWDLPYELQCRGGWVNDDIADLFGSYAKVIAENFSDRVSHFITLNEPQVFIGLGYLDGKHAPGYKDRSPREMLRMGHNVLRAHGKAVEALRKYSHQPVKIGLASASCPAYPKAETPELIKAARQSYFNCAHDRFVYNDAYWFDPIYLGKYNDGLIEKYGDIMPKITPEDMALISQPIDFYGLNIYQGREVDENGNTPRKTGFPRTSINWIINEQALYWGPKFIYERYHKPIYITENGMAAHDRVSLDGKVHDPNRIDYMQRYLREFLRAGEDGTDIAGYFAWSLMDNFEWGYGYNERFGLIYVDYQTQERTLKDSAVWYGEVIKTNGEIL